jgi:hypothetical protein
MIADFWARKSVSGKMKSGGVVMRDAALVDARGVSMFSRFMLVFAGPGCFFKDHPAEAYIYSQLVSGCIEGRTCKKSWMNLSVIPAKVEIHSFEILSRAWTHFFKGVTIFCSDVSKYSHHL